MERRDFFKKLLVLGGGMLVSPFKLLASSSNFSHYELNIEEFNSFAQLKMFATNVGATKYGNQYIYNDTMISVFHVVSNKKETTISTYSQNGYHSSTSVTSIKGNQITQESYSSNSNGGGNISINNVRGRGNNNVIIQGNNNSIQMTNVRGQGNIQIKNENGTSVNIQGNKRNRKISINNNNVNEGINSSRICFHNQAYNQDIVNLNNIHLSALTFLSHDFGRYGNHYKAAMRTIPDISYAQYVENNEGSFINQIGAKEGKIDLDYNESTKRIKIVSEKWTGFDKDRKEAIINLI